MDVNENELVAAPDAVVRVGEERSQNGLGNVVPDRPTHLRNTAEFDRLDPTSEKEIDLPGFQQSVVLGISRIVHR